MLRAHFGHSTAYRADHVFMKRCERRQGTESMGSFNRKVGVYPLSVLGIAIFLVMILCVCAAHAKSTLDEKSESLAVQTVADSDPNALLEALEQKHDVLKNEPQELNGIAVLPVKSVSESSSKVVAALVPLEPRSATLNGLSNERVSPLAMTQTESVSPLPRVVAAFAFVATLIVGGALLFGKKLAHFGARLSSRSNREGLRLKQNLSLGFKRNLAWVEFGGVEILVGMTPTQMQLLYVNEAEKRAISATAPVADVSCGPIIHDSTFATEIFHETDQVFAETLAHAESVKEPQSMAQKILDRVSMMRPVVKERPISTYAAKAYQGLSLSYADVSEVKRHDAA